MKNIEFDFSLLLHSTASKKETPNFGDFQMEGNITSEILPGHTETNLISRILKLKKENIQLLKHPLLENFLMMKWQKIAGIYTSWILFKVFFFCILVFLVLAEYWPNIVDPENSFHSNGTDLQSLSSESNQCQTENNSLVLRTILGVSSFMLLFVEFFQILAFPMDYFRSFLNYFQMCIIIGTLYLVFSDDPSICSRRIHVAGVLLPFTYLETI